MPIHPTAIVDRRAEVHPTAQIEAFAVVQPGTIIGPECHIWHHAFIASGTTLGRGVQVHPFAVVGHHPQDLAWNQTPSYATVGDGTIIREQASIHRGTPPESTTVVGRNCYLMACAHVGHNCELGDEVKLANGAALGGWVQVGDRTFISAMVGAHQFVRIGELCMVAALTRVTQDLCPFLLTSPDGPIGVNLVGMRRASLTAEERAEIRSIYRTLYRSGQPWSRAIAQVLELGRTPAGRRMVDFLRAPSKRGFLRLRKLAVADNEPDVTM